MLRKLWFPFPGDSLIILADELCRPPVKIVMRYLESEIINKAVRLFYGRIHVGNEPGHLFFNGSYLCP